jgi:YVTN family beta-propeller protein
MPNLGRTLGICFQIASVLLVSGCILVTYRNNADAQVSENTFESVVNQTGVKVSPQITSGNYPLHIYGDFDIPTIYVANGDSDTVTVIDTTNNTVYRNLRVGISPVHIYGDPLLGNTSQDISQDILYVANSGSDSVSLINATTDTVNNKTIPVGISPVYIFGDLKASDTIYVANSLSNSVSAINTTTNTVEKEISVGVNPMYIFGDLSASDTIYVANFFSDSVSAINTTTNTVEKEISVGVNPVDIFGDPSLDTIYVANFDSNSVSVIDTTTNTVGKEITVGLNPVDIFGDPSLDTIYVANFLSDSVSVINTTTDTVNNKTIPVGISPVHIFGNLSTLDIFGDLSTPDTIYVANSLSDSVSVINTTTDTVEKEIPVGVNPRYIFVDPYLRDVYVANGDSGGVSVIDGKTNEAVAGVTFNVSPFGGGDVLCNLNNKDLEAPTNRFFYVSTGSKCIAKPSKGFEFSSWVEVLDSDSTRTLNSSSGSPYTAFLDAINIKPDEPTATLTVNRFGNFTSHFRALPPAIPSEYLIPLYGIVASTVIGFSIPSIVNWHKSKKQISRLNSYHHEMTSLYDDGKLDEKDIGRLNELNKKIIDAYSEGKINNEQYTNLKNEISVLYEEIYSKRIDSLKDITNEDLNRGAIIEKIQGDIIDSYSKGKLSELHYNLLKEKITKMTSKNDERE